MIESPSNTIPQFVGCWVITSIHFIIYPLPVYSFSRRGLSGHINSTKKYVWTPIGILLGGMVYGDP